MIAYLARLLRRLFGGSDPAPRAAVPDTLIDRRLWALGYLPADTATVHRAREVEAALKRQLRALAPLPADGSATGRHIQNLRVHVLEYLDAQEGALARAIRTWPGGGPEEVAARESVFAGGEDLCVQAERALERWEVLVGTRQRIASLRSRFESSVPVAWTPYAGASGLEAQAARAYSLGRIRTVAEAVEEADRHLTSHLAEMESLERELSSRLRGPGDEQMVLPMGSVEERVLHLIELAGRRVAESREPMGAELEDLCARQVDHTGYRPHSLRLHGKARGSIRRSGVWCEHLRAARRRYRS